MLNNSHSHEPVYKTLSEIRLRKAQLQTDIAKDNQRMSKLWNDVFHNENRSTSPTRRLSGFMNTGAGIIDGLLLGWKLYRRFGGGKKRNRGKFFW
ncbi:UNVERIFIED_CONTAM: hypothetical protein NY100_05625 [Prevotella sp. 15_C9]